MSPMRWTGRAMGLLRARLLTGGLLATAILTAAPVPGAPPGSEVVEPAAPGETATPDAKAAVLESPVTVRFVEPSPPALIIGDTRITVEAATASGDHIVSVRIYADGNLLTILETPPYSLVWNAGSGFSRLVLRAVAVDSSGRRGRAVLVARPLRIGQYEEVRLVNVFATVRDSRGRVVLDLTRDEFTVLEDGEPQTVSHFSSARVPLTVALLIDASNSMNLGGKIEFARKAAEEFLESIGEDDRLMIVQFNDTVTVLDGPTGDRDRLEEAIEGIRAEGGTALYDAVYRTADRLSGIEGRRAIVLLSDGRDQALTDNEPGSLHLFEEALERAHRAEVAIYSVGLGKHLESELDIPRVRNLKEILDTFATQTGGRSHFPSRAGKLSGVYRQIAEDLRAQYTLGYTSANRERDGRWRSITVRVAEERFVVEARSGYYAPGPRPL